MYLELLGNDKRQDYPDADSNKSLAENFAQFFESKVQSIHHRQLSVTMDDKCNDHNKFAIGNTVAMLNCFRHVPEEAIHATVLGMQSKSCMLDVIPLGY